MTTEHKMMTRSNAESERKTPPPGALLPQKTGEATPVPEKKKEARFADAREV
jgi:hypothetical protein